MRNLRVWINVFNSDKAFVGLDAGIRIDVQTALFQDFEIVRCPSGASDRQNQSGEEAN